MTLTGTGPTEPSRPEDAGAAAAPEHRRRLRVSFGRLEGPPCPDCGGTHLRLLHMLDVPQPGESARRALFECRACAALFVRDPAGEFRRAATDPDLPAGR